MPGVSARRRLQGAGLPVPDGRQRFVQPADPERQCTLCDVRRVARRDGHRAEHARAGQRARCGRRRNVRIASELPRARECVRRGPRRVRRQRRHRAAADDEDAVPDAGLSAAAAAFLARRSAGPVAVRPADRERIDRLGRPRGRPALCAECRRDDPDVDLAVGPEPIPGRHVGAALLDLERGADCAFGLQRRKRRGAARGARSAARAEPIPIR